MHTCPRCHMLTQQSPCAHCGAHFAVHVISHDQQTPCIHTSPSGYQVEGLIAKGGMGIVMRGVRLRDGHRVALKAPRFNNHHARARFTREVRALASLDHPYVLKLLDIDATSRGIPLLITECIAGETLQQRIQRPPLLNIDEFHTIAHKMSKALAHCHRRGVIHRDIKPDNILLHENDICLIDFGLALLECDRKHLQRLTPEGIALGTPPYAAPEQIHNPLSSSYLSDSYSLGMVLKDCFHHVEWGTSAHLHQYWYQCIQHLTQHHPQQRQSIEGLLKNWPTRYLTQPQKAVQQRFPLLALASAGILGIIAATALILPLLQSQGQPRQLTLHGWMDESGRGTVSIPLQEGSTAYIIPQNNTRVRLLGSGAWSESALRVQGNQSGVLRIRVASMDDSWTILVEQ